MRLMGYDLFCIYLSIIIINIIKKINQKPRPRPKPKPLNLSSQIQIIHSNSSHQIPQSIIILVLFCFLQPKRTRGGGEEEEEEVICIGLVQQWRGTCSSSVRLCVDSGPS